MYRPVLDAVAGSLFITALVAMLPLLALFVLLGVVRMRAWLASVIALAVAILVAVIAYSMPVSQAVLAATEGAAFGFFPILWIVINAIWIYNMTVVTGHFDVLRRSFTRVSDDARIQAVIVAFCFGALLEALAGFGTPVAITTVMLMALGFRPFKAAAVSLVANTAPVAFGALATPITTLAAVSGLPEHALSQMVGRQTPILGLFVPMALVFIIDRGKGVRETLPATLTCGVAFAITQFVTSNYISTQLTDIVASLVSALAVVLLLRVWQPANRYVELDTAVTAGAGTGGAAQAAASTGAPAATPAAARAGRQEGGGSDHPIGEGVGTQEDLAARDAAAHDTRSDVIKAYAPYLIVVVVFVLAQLPGIKDLLAKPLTTLVPAFVLSELRSAFVIGFLVFIPFLVIDLVVSAALMSLGMMMLPPVTVALPFKLLLFVLVNGWGLIITALVSSYK